MKFRIFLSTIPFWVFVSVICGVSLGEQEQHIGERPPPKLQIPYITPTPVFIDPAKAAAFNEAEKQLQVLAWPTITPSPTPKPLLPIPNNSVSAASFGSSYVMGLPGGGCGYGPTANHPNPYCPDLISLLDDYDWPIREAQLVVSCESAGDAHAISPTGCIGLFQICGSGEPTQYFDPEVNVAAAYSKYQHGITMGNPWYHWNNFGTCGRF